MGKQKLRRFPEDITVDEDVIEILNEKILPRYQELIPVALER